jgi:hypothetical protein
VQIILSKLTSKEQTKKVQIAGMKRKNKNKIRGCTAGTKMKTKSD